jgi:hypothetical protein
LAFVAVNSGNSAAQVSQYVRKHRIPWPVIVDPDRSFEAACDVGDISLTNIWQAKVITADGQLVRASATELDQAAERALNGAKWNVDPTKMTPELQTAWQNIEFGNFAPAAATLKRFLRSRKTEIKDAATLLTSYVDEQLQSRLESAAEADAAEESWKAFKLLTEIEQKFKGYKLPPNVAADLTRLEISEDVKNQLAAYRKLTLAQKAARSSSSSSRKRAATMLQLLIKEFSKTDAAEDAQQLLSR